MWHTRGSLCLAVHILRKQTFCLEKQTNKPKNPKAPKQQHSAGEMPKRTGWQQGRLSFSCPPTFVFSLCTLSPPYSSSFYIK